MKAVNKEHRILVVDGYSETLRIKIEKYVPLKFVVNNTINQIRIIPHGCMNTLWTMVSAK